MHCAIWLQLFVQVLILVFFNGLGHIFKHTLKVSDKTAFRVKNDFSLDLWHIAKSCIKPAKKLQIALGRDNNLYVFIQDFNS